MHATYISKLKYIEAFASDTQKCTRNKFTSRLNFLNNSVYPSRVTLKCVKIIVINLGNVRGAIQKSGENNLEKKSQVDFTATDVFSYRDVAHVPRFSFIRQLIRERRVFSGWIYRAKYRSLTRTQTIYRTIEFCFPRFPLFELRK